MRHRVLWMPLLFCLPQVAAAQGAIGAAAPLIPGSAGAMQLVDAATLTAAPGLDLRFDPAQLPDREHQPYGAPALESDWADDPELDAADRGLSFGLELKPRSRLGALARQGEPGDSDLGNQLERLIEQPVLGLRGRYRF